MNDGVLYLSTFEPGAAVAAGAAGLDVREGARQGAPAKLLA